MRLQFTALVGIVLNGTPWRDLPKSFEPLTTCYNRFIRWRRAGISERDYEPVGCHA
jgi:transposase